MSVCRKYSLTVCTVADYVVVNTTISGRNYTTSRDVTAGLVLGVHWVRIETRNGA